MHKKTNPASRLLVSLLAASLAFPIAVPVAMAQASNEQQNANLSQAQLAALVAPIALYPDPLVSQILMASTYPLEVAEAANWQKANSSLKAAALDNALQQQPWDASVKSLVNFPPVIQMMGSQLTWTQNLGNAVLAQQSDVMNAIQSLRAKAKQAGQLQSTPQQTVTSQGSGSNEVIVIQPANPQVVYVPSYNPNVVYGGWPYPAYPPYAYSGGAMLATGLLSFGAGMAVGAALWGGCHWGGGGWGGGNSLTVNNNTYNNFAHNTGSNALNGRGSSNWNFNPQHRGNVAYPNSSLANKYGGGTERQHEEERDQLSRNFGEANRNQDRNQMSRDANVAHDQVKMDQRDDASRQTEQQQAERDRNGMEHQSQRDAEERGGEDERFGGGEHFGGRR